MHTASLLTSLLLGFLALPGLAANEQLSALQAADDRRVAAMQNPDAAALGAIFSDDLRYAHSNGAVDTKASFIELLTSGKTKYAGYEYEDRTFTFPATGIALMTGRVKIKAVSGENTTEATLSFLGIWRLEANEWRFLAWQSCKLPATPKP